MISPIQYVTSVGGVEVALRDFGGDGPPLLISHATGFHAMCYSKLAKALSERYHCWAIDLRGHGDSRYPDDVDLDWRLMGSDIAAALAFAVGDEPVFGVGHSMGGVAIALAELDHPGTFRAAWLYEPVLFPFDVLPEGQNPMAEPARRRREVFESHDAVFDSYWSRPPFNSIDPVVLRAYIDHGFARQDDGSVLIKCRGATEAAVFEHFGSGAFERLADLEIPVALARSGDGGRPALVQDLVLAQLAYGELIEFENLNHFGPFQDSEQIADSIHDYFVRSDPATERSAS
ncbi:MAG: alpha/beta hydrolase [Acidimicrobiales bacterium]